MEKSYKFNFLILEDENVTPELCIALNQNIKILKQGWLEAVLEYKKWLEVSKWQISEKEIRKRYWGVTKTES